MKFEAEAIKILLAEDDEINREVVLDILSPLNMNIDVAVNGEDALSKVKSTDYDFIFMDYLMPVMDGAEATRQIRRLGLKYRTIPIVALTASSDELDTLLDAGMSDYIVKPISYEKACNMLVEWLPKGSVYLTSEEENGKKATEEDLPEIEGINTSLGVSNSGSARLFKKLLSDYALVGERKAENIENLLKDGSIDDFRIEVHALKSSSNLCGAKKLSADFEKLEKLAKEKDIDGLNSETGKVLEKYRELTEAILKSSGHKENVKNKVSHDYLLVVINKIIKDAENFYLDGVDSGFNELAKCELPDGAEEAFEELRACIEDVDLGHVNKVAAKLAALLEE